MIEMFYPFDEWDIPIGKGIMIHNKFSSVDLISTSTPYCCGSRQSSLIVFTLCL